MKTTPDENRRACQEHLGRFFGAYREVTMAKAAMKALRFLAASGVAMEGKPSGWAAGIIYALGNADRQACGVPWPLNKEFGEFFDVSMSTIRKRAAQVRKALVT
jgi:hypothetical protein